MISQLGCQICPINQFSNCLNIYLNTVCKLRYFQNNGKRVNIATIHNKCEKQLAKSCRSVSLLPTCGKVLQFIISNDLSSFSASISFYPGRFVHPSSCVLTRYIKFLTIIHLLKFKVFVWISQKFLIMCGLYKLKPEVVNGALLKVMETFFIRQITENHVKWTNCQVEQHKGSGSSRVYFRSAIFFVYLSDLSSELCRSPKLLADNKSPFSVAKMSTKLLRDQIKILRT